MKQLTIVTALAIGLGSLATSAQALPVTFSTFVTQAAIDGAEAGQNNTIGFTYAGNKFVGSLYLGANNFQLYSTDLTGGSVTAFGLPMSGAAGETVLAASLGHSGFAAGDIYSSPANSSIYHYANSGGSPSLFGNVPDGAVVRQIFFDPGSNFGGEMLVATNAGHIYSFSSLGIATLVATVTDAFGNPIDIEGLDIASTVFGSKSGSLLVTSETTGSLYAVDPISHIVSIVATGLTEAETVSVVPLNLGSSLNPVEGFYVANYPVNIQKAAAAEFNSYLGDAIVTEELGSLSNVYDIHWDGTNFVQTLIGSLANQSEDGIFVTAQRIHDVNPTPEPLTISLFGAGLVGAVAMRRRKKSA